MPTPVEPLSLNVVIEAVIFIDEPVILTIETISPEEKTEFGIVIVPLASTYFPMSDKAKVVLVDLGKLVEP